MKAGGALAAVAAAAIVHAPTYRPAEVQVENADNLDPALDVLQGSALRLPAGGRDERRALKDRGLVGRPSCPPSRLRRYLRMAPFEAFMASTVHWAEGPGMVVVLHRPVRLEPGGHDGLEPPERRPQALGGVVRRL